MSRQAVAQSLATTVDQLIEALETLEDDLCKEREALNQRSSAQDLEYVALRKSAAVEHVSDLYGTLREALAAGHGGEDVGRALADVGAHQPALKDRVARLLELTRTCQLANQENGAMVGAALRGSERALGTLRELAAGEANSTYSSSGQTHQNDAASQGVTVRA